MQITVDEILNAEFKPLRQKKNIAVNSAESLSLAEIRLYGPIGQIFENGISGAQIAEEITALSERFENIVIRINTYGGSVADGMSIIAAMQKAKAKAKIYAIVDGVAASIGAVIALFADVTYIVDYGLMMTHGTNFANGEGDSSTLEKFDGALSIAFQKRLNKTAEEVSEFMQKGIDRWFNADEARLAGLVNDVIPTAARDLVNEAQAILNNGSATLTCIESVVNLFNQEKTNQNQMEKEILNALNLNSASTAAEVINAVGELKNKLTQSELTVESLRADVTNKANEVASLQAKISEFETAEAARVTEEIKSVVNAAAVARKISNSPESIARWTTLATANLSATKETLNAMSATQKFSEIVKGDDTDKVKKFQPITIANMMLDIDKATRGK